MMVIELKSPGGPEALTVGDRPVATPGPGEIRIRHKAVGLNFIDTYQRKGLYPLPLPAVLGSEAVGMVEAVGPNVTRFKLGDRAAYAGPMGAYAETNVVKADQAVHVPDGIADDIAAVVMLKGMTAEYLLRRCFPVQPGQTILVHAAAGATGGMMVQWASALGARVIGTAGSEDKAALAKHYGAEAVILYRQENVAERVRALTGGEGVAAVYDSVGAATFEGSLNSLKRRGWLVSFGNASGPLPPIDALRLMRAGSLVLTRPTLGDFVATTEELDASATAVFAAIATGVIIPKIGQRFALEDAAEAHRALESRATIGASVLTV
jgi:NADPH2:quinone reductase